LDQVIVARGPVERVIADKDRGVYDRELPQTTAVGAAERMEYQAR